MTEEICVVGLLLRMSCMKCNYRYALNGQLKTLSISLVKTTAKTVG